MHALNGIETTRCPWLLQKERAAFSLAVESGVNITFKVLSLVATICRKSVYHRNTPHEKCYTC